MRFPEFSGEWEKCKVSGLLDFYSTNSLAWEQLEYGVRGLKNLHYGLIHNGLSTCVDVDAADLPTIKESHVPKKYTLCKEGDVAFADASEDTNDVAKCVEFTNCAENSIVCGLHTIHGRDKSNKTVIGFKGYAFSAQSFRHQIRRLAQGTKIYSINSKNFSECYIGIPSKEEQSKIATLLSLIDQRIETQKKIIEDLKKLKDAIRTKLFRHIESACTTYDEIRNMLDYEQPSEYLVSSTEYSDNYLTPVLTANKAFILGYTDDVHGIYDKGDCIILDDFTMDVKYVSFPFKVKSSAIKILTAKKDVDLYFMYEYLLHLDLVSEEHKRHYISEIEPMTLSCPTLQEQKRIAQTLKALDMQVQSANRLNDLLLKQKQYIVSQMFI